MPVNYTNHKGQTYTLYRGQTKTGKPRYYFGRMGQSQGGGEPVTELPLGFTISESVNGIVSLVKDRPSLIIPSEVMTIEAAIKQHPEANRYRITVKHDYIEIYEQSGQNLNELFSELQRDFQLDPGRVARAKSEMEQRANYAPVLRFFLLDPTQRLFGTQRMCYRSSVNGWLELRQTGPVAELAHTLIPILGTDLFYDLW